jgi:hypothetical protein
MAEPSLTDKGHKARNRVSSLSAVTVLLMVLLGMGFAFIARLTPPGPASLSPECRLDFPPGVPVSGRVADEAVGTWYFELSRGTHTRLQLRADGTYWQEFGSEPCAAITGSWSVSGNSITLVPFRAKNLDNGWRTKRELEVVNFDGETLLADPEDVRALKQGGLLKKGPPYRREKDSQRDAWGRHRWSPGG